MFTNNKKNRMYLFVVAVVCIAVALIAAFKTGSVSKTILILYLLGIVLLFLHQMLRLHEIKNMIEDKKSRGEKRKK